MNPEEFRAFGHRLIDWIADYRAVWDVISSLEPVWLAALALATALNVVTYAPPWMVARARPTMALRFFWSYWRIVANSSAA